MTESFGQLIDAACTVRRHSYSPYSGFRVGAALLGKSGRIYVGTNVENASFGLSLCAERAALVRAIAEGERSFTAIAVCADGEAPTPPCGACRQALLEFGGDLEVILAGAGGRQGPVGRFRLSDLVPEAFTTFTPDARPAGPGRKPAGDEA